jgi:hypothetical protein
MLFRMLPAGAEQLHFGLGCMQFIPKQERLQNLTISQYCDMLDQSLRSISSISDISIGGFADHGQEFSGKVDILHKGGYLWPASDLRLQLSVHIPFRVQDELGEGFIAIDTKTEDFSLLLSLAYYSPVAIVFVGSEEGASGSTGVYILKKFLEKSLNDAPGSRVTLDIQGPSHLSMRTSLWCRNQLVPQMTINP